VTAGRGALRLRGTTRVVGVMGWPVSHSLSPVIHNAAFAALDLDWAYVPLPTPPGRVAEALAGLRALGVAGANVTMPHKTEIAGLIEEATEDAVRLRAVNTLAVGVEVITGHNTDAPGFERFVVRDAGFDPAGRSALLFGAGGAARAVALALARAGLARLTVALREPARAEQVAGVLDGFATEMVAVAFDRAGDAEADLIVNATPLGGRGEVLPIPHVGPETVAVDLIYRPTLTPLQTAVRRGGGSAFGGMGLLLEQAALSFELWTGQPAPMDVMSAAALAAAVDASEPAAPGDGDGGTSSEGPAGP
jgi:shikimate dehydrogenase